MPNEYVRPLRSSFTWGTAMRIVPSSCLSPHVSPEKPRLVIRCTCCLGCSSTSYERVVERALHLCFPLWKKTRKKSQSHRFNRLQVVDERNICLALQSSAYVRMLLLYQDLSDHVSCNSNLQCLYLLGPDCVQVQMNLKKRKGKYTQCTVENILCVYTQ